MNVRRAFLSVLVLTAAVIATSMSIGYAAPENPPRMVERSVERSNWKAKAVFNKDEGYIGAAVDYGISNAQQVQELASSQKQIADELAIGGASSFEVTAVFRHPVSQADFEKLVVDAGLDVSGYTLRYLSNSGQRVTINGAPENGSLVPQNSFTMVLSDLQQHDPGTLLGWVEVQAKVTSKNYATLVSDQNVYLVDVSRSIIRAMFKDEIGSEVIPVQVITSPLYWKLEDLHLVPNS